MSTEPDEQLKAQKAAEKRRKAAEMRRKRVLNDGSNRIKGRWWKHSL